MSKTIQRKSDIDGTTAQAWKIKHCKDTDLLAELESYLLEGPFHVFWDKWIMVLIHLGDLPGMGPPDKLRANYTHQVTIFSLDPSTSDLIDPDKPILPFPTLSPPDICAQFEAPSDDVAVYAFRAMVQSICDGKASPDSDYRRFWDIELPNLVALQMNPKAVKDKGFH